MINRLYHGCQSSLRHIRLLLARETTQVQTLELEKQYDYDVSSYQRD